MSVRDRVLLPLYRSDDAGPEPVFDLGSLFLNLLVFDTVIVPSLALLDVAALGKAIGVGPTVALLNSGSVRIRAAADALGSVEFPNGNLVQLQHLFAVDPEDSFRRYVDDAFPRNGLLGDDALALEAATRARWIRPEQNERWAVDAISDMVREATGDTAVWRVAVGLVLREHGINLEVGSGQVRMDVLNPENNLMRFQSRLPNVAAALATKVVRRACSVVANLNGELHRMKRDQAITALDEDSTALMETKLEFLYRAAGGDARVAQFHRVVDAAGLPSFDDAIRDGTIDVERLLEVRETQECREFRNFLTRADQLNDRELNERLTSLRARVGNFLQGGPGKLMRLLVTTGVGAVVAGPVGVAAGLAVDSADSFIIERLFPTSGVVNFVGKQFPSIFGKK